MKNINVLPTPNNKPTKSSIWSKETASWSNIYITSDEPIKEGNWVLCGGISLLKVKKERTYDAIKLVNNDFETKKIILTTDQDLIKDGVQAIDYDFLEWFVKNPSCEEVEIFHQDVYSIGEWDRRYKIIIPKQELPQFGTKEFNDLANQYFSGKPKQEIKLEDVFNDEKKDALNHFLSTSSFIVKDPHKYDFNKKETTEKAAREYYKRGQLGFGAAANTEEAFLRGAIWQQEQISKSEFLQKLRATMSNAEARRLILETFKNK